MDYIIYTFGGNAELIKDIFNAIAMIFKTDSNYITAVGKFSMTIGAIWAATRAIFNANIAMFGKEWFLPSFLLFTFLFSPKAMVHIHDDVTKKQYSVDNIPFAIAFFSSLPSKLSHFIASEIEEKMQIAERIKSTSSGLMFGAKLVSKVKDIKIQDPVLLDNAKNFSKQCYLRPWIMGNLLGKRYEAENTKDIMTFLRANKANNFGIYYKNEDGNIEFKSCKEITVPLLAKIEEESRSSKLLGSFGAALGMQGNSADDIATRLTETGNSALSSLSAANQNIHNWVRQAMMLNLYRESLDDWREASGHQRLWPEIISMNATRGLYQQSLGWMTAGEMAAQFLPLLQTIVFLVVVSSIFIVFPISMLPGGYSMFKMWLQSMIWVHSWPIFFAIINSIGIKILASSHIGFDDGDAGLSKLAQGSYSDILIHTYAIIQMFASMVPILSWMLLSKSGYTFSSMVERLSPVGVGASIGAASVDNNINMDNVSIGNRQLAQQNVGANLNMGTSLDTGAIKTTQSTGGTTFIDEKASNLARNYRGSQMESTAINDAYSKQISHMDSLSQRSNYLDSLEQSQMQDYAKRWLESSDASSSSNNRLAESMRQVANYSHTDQQGYSSRDNKSVDTHSGIDVDPIGAAGSIAGAAGKAVIKNTPIGKAVDKALDFIPEKLQDVAALAGKTASNTLGSKHLKTNIGTSARNTYDTSHDSASSTASNYQDSYEKVRDYAKNHDLRLSSGTSDTLSENLQNTWRSQEQIAREKAATQQEMHSLQEQLSYTQSNQASIDTNWNDKVLDATAAKHNLAGKEEALSYLKNHDSEGEEILRRLIDEKYQNSFPSPTSHRQQIQDHANSGISDIPDDYSLLSKSMEDKYMAQNHDHEDFKSNIEGSLSEVENIAQTAEQIEKAEVSVW
jgi:conjugal transfer mating pair stabilization protein TraG